MGTAAVTLVLGRRLVSETVLSGNGDPLVHAIAFSVVAAVVVGIGSPRVGALSVAWEALCATDRERGSRAEPGHLA